MSGCYRQSPAPVAGRLALARILHHNPSHCLLHPAWASVVVRLLCLDSNSASTPCLPASLLAGVADAKHCLQPLKSLLLDKIGSNLSAAALEDVNSLDFAGFRDKLLAQGPLDISWVKKARAWVRCSSLSELALLSPRAPTFWSKKTTA